MSVNRPVTEDIQHMKNIKKVKKIVRVTFTYKEYEGGGRSLKYDHDKAEEIVKWVAQDYLSRLIMEERRS